MKIKICGLKYPENISEIISLNPDYIGFIFYPNSKRYVDLEILEQIIKSIPENIKKVGVFVNENQKKILEYSEKFNLDFIQLHGNETVDFCKELNQKNIRIIKAFSVKETFDFDELVTYEPYIDYFLFDTFSEQYGGSGKTFNWKVLDNYKLSKPFFLSGGLSDQNTEDILEFTHHKFYGVDANSKLEESPAIKDYNKTKTFIKNIRYE